MRQNRAWVLAWEVASAYPSEAHLEGHRGADHMQFIGGEGQAAAQEAPDGQFSSFIWL